ncbi:hypothetical protein ACFP1I_09215 [Dyadobacter subterraneus]|uniref:Type VI secretion, VasB, ImpH, VC_A0111 n=1 Tax=Dyadobacter subterraneus TaxID=2773304 RepID=A0ABR9WB73_9BACT|nr:hypothetical protein [Dyadobacter subterraneus]MBE9462718.1 hypothetical protein [Dyadobacter subterraneus]
MEAGHNILFEAENDLKAEFFAASLLEAGLRPEQITFRALGPFKRRSHNDIESAEEKEIGNFTGLVIESNRSGIYDYLPEQLFHLSSSKSGKELKKKIEDIRIEREKEQKTRLFFLPLEQEFFFNKVRTEQIEQQSSALDPDSSLFEELRYFWQIPSFVSDITFRQLLPLLPQVSEFRADFKKCEIVLTRILNVSVEISEKYGKNIFPTHGSEIGIAALGMDLFLGGALDSGLPELQINLSFNNTDELEKYFSDPDFDKLISWLLGWLLPVEYDNKINILTPLSTWWLTEERNSLILPRLGYTTMLEFS